MTELRQYTYPTKSLALPFSTFHCAPEDESTLRDDRPRLAGAAKRAFFWTAPVSDGVDDRYVALGYDLVADDVEDFAHGDRTPIWTIDADDARLVFQREHLWAYLKGAFVEIPPELRVRHTVEGESRERLREAFNTPLYPMILVANEVMQEGLDLHHHCRRVVHHDLAWNPAQLEHRVGRVDRLGSLLQRLRERQPDTTLDVLQPLIANTIDERLERTVRLRERWLEFLLGASPKIEEHGLTDEPAQPLPPAFADALRVELGPTE